MVSAASPILIVACAILREPFSDRAALEGFGAPLRNERRALLIQGEGIR